MKSANQFQLSPMVKAVDLLRVNVDSLQLDDLECHLEDVTQTIFGLLEVSNGFGFMSAFSASNIRRLESNLRFHLDTVRNSIEARKSEAETDQVDPATGSVRLKSGASGPVFK